MCLQTQLTSDILLCSKAAVSFYIKIQVYKKRLLTYFDTFSSPFNQKPIEELSDCLMQICVGLIKNRVEIGNGIDDRFRPKKGL